MRNMTCIVCPIGCSLDIDDSDSSDNLIETNINVTGNKCERGIVYAAEEIRAPKRVVTATVSSPVMRIPVKTSSPCLREKIPALLQDIYKIKINLPVKAGDVVIENWNGEGIDVIATRTVSGE